MGPSAEPHFPRRTLLAILAVALIPLLLLGGLAIVTLRRVAGTVAQQSRVALDLQAGRALELRAVETAAAIARFLDEREADLRLAALLRRDGPTWRTFLRSRTGELWLLEDGHEQRPHVPLYCEMAWVDASGRERLKVLGDRLARPDELRDVSDPAQTTFHSETYFAEARALTPGAVSISHMIGLYVSRDEAQAGRRFWGVLRLVAPAHDERGRFTGALVLTLDGRHLEAFTDHVIPTDPGLAVVADQKSGNYAYLIDNLGRAIAHPDDSVQWGLAADGSTLPIASKKEEIGRLPVLLHQLGFADENLASIPGRAATGHAGSVQYQWAGKQKFVAYAPVPYFGGGYRPPLGFGWVGIAAEVSTFHHAAAALDEVVRARVRLLMAVSFIILLAAGTIVGLTGRVIADRLRRAWADARHAELALAVSERNFRELVDRALIGIYRTTPSGSLVEANPALLRMLGARGTEDVNRIGLVNLYVDPQARRRFLEQLQAGPVTGFEIEFRRIDGSTFPASLAGHQVVDDEGTPLLIEGTFEDVTERRRAREQLEQAKRVAEAASLAKSNFLANMSHELRTPLNAIIGYAEMLLEEAQERGDERASADVTRIADSGRHLLRLIDNILDLSKIEAGRVRVVPTEFEAASVVREVAHDTAPLVEKNGNHLTVEIPDDLGRMCSDVVMLRRSVRSLLSNAGKFTERGEIDLRATCERRDGMDWLVVSVRDTGIGLSEEQLSRLFQPFTQVDASSTRRFGGSGLGLAITRLFCRMLGGDVRAASEPGLGSTFTIEVPMRSPELGEPGAVVGEGPAVAAPEAREAETGG